MFPVFPYLLKIYSVITKAACNRCAMFAYRDQNARQKNTGNISHTAEDGIVNSQPFLIKRLAQTGWLLQALNDLNGFLQKVFG